MTKRPQRNSQLFYPENVSQFRENSFEWASRFTHCAYFCPNNLNYLFGPFLHFIAADAVSTITLSKSKNSFDEVQSYHHKTQDWLVGNLTYDLKNEVEKLESSHADLIGFEPMSFFQPRHLIFFSDSHVEILSFDDPSLIFDAINKTSTLETRNQESHSPESFPRSLSSKSKKYSGRNC